MNYKIFQLSEEELLKEIPLILYNNKYKKRDIICTKDYIYVKGNIPIILISHLDTVHRDLPSDIYIDEEKQAYWSPEGLGADDRAGVCAILDLLKYKPYILFTTQEETGAEGAIRASKEITLPKKIKFAIEFDRQGNNDCVFYDCDNSEFKQYIEQFGFKTAIGTFSDISILCPKWGIAGVNLSIGYYNAHTLKEYLKYNEFHACIIKAENILNNLPNERFNYIQKKYIPLSFKKYNMKDWEWDEEGFDYNENIEELFDYLQEREDYECCICGDNDNLTSLNDDMYCETCFNEQFFYCDTCGEYKSKLDQSLADNNICEDCYKILINK